MTNCDSVSSSKEHLPMSNCMFAQCQELTQFEGANSSNAFITQPLNCTVSAAGWIAFGSGKPPTTRCEAHTAEETVFDERTPLPPRSTRQHSQRTPALDVLSSLAHHRALRLPLRDSQMRPDRAEAGVVFQICPDKRQAGTLANIRLTCTARHLQCLHQRQFRSQ